MPPTGIRWTVQDRYGHTIYLTQERWEHIIAPLNHPEVAPCEAQLRETIQRGSRKQDALNPHKYRYTRPFSQLPAENTHVVAIVFFQFRASETGALLPNNYIVTAYLKTVG